MGSKKKQEEDRPRLRLDEIARSGRMRIYDQSEIVAEKQRQKQEAGVGIIARLKNSIQKLKRTGDDSDDAIRKLLESDSFGASKSRIRFTPVERSDDVSANHRDIGNLWSEQERIRKEDEQLERSYKQAREDAKALKKQLLKNQIGEGFASQLSHRLTDLYSQLSDLPLRLSGVLRRGRPSHTASKASSHNRNALSVVGFSRFAEPKRLAGAFIVVLVITTVIFGVSRSLQKQSAVGQNDTLGSQVTAGTLPKEAPPFKLLYPAGSNESSLETVRVSPAGNAPAYAYIDTLQTAQLKITQQELPEQFKDARETQLEELAKSFQATSVIQVDESKLYHGYNEKTRVQSLIFIKQNLLIFVASSERLSDDTWAGYFLSLK